MIHKKSLYDFAESRQTRVKNHGFDYEGKIFRRSLSSFLFGDPKRAAIIDQFEKHFFFLVQKVKTIKAFFNYAAKKDGSDIN